MDHEEVVLCIKLDDFYKKVFGLKKPATEVQRKIFTDTFREKPFVSKSEYYLDNIKPIWKKRGGIEQDLNYLQIIPYVIVKSYQGNYLTYKRSDNSGDPRLFDNYSAGLGGHVKETTDSYGDGEQIKSYFKILLNCAYRELVEELTEVNNPENYTHKLSQIGWMYFPINEIDMVHLCAIFLFEVNELDLDIDAFCSENASKMKWMKRHEILNLFADPKATVETWTKTIFTYNDEIV